NENPAYTASTQWFERTLDDSSNRRIVMPEAFLTCDAVLVLLESISNRLNINPELIREHVQEELPFMATENILAAAVKKGGDRQELHEKLRILCNTVKKNELLNMIMTDSSFNFSKEEWKEILQTSNFTGRASQQVEEFLSNEVWPKYF